MSRIVSRLQKAFSVHGDYLARDALSCIRELETALAALVADPTSKAALRNASAVLRKLSPGKDK